METQPNHEYSVTLVLNEVSLEDAGQYKIIAQNVVGEVAASMNVHFEGEDTTTKSPVLKRSKR